MGQQVLEEMGEHCMSQSCHGDEYGSTGDGGKLVPAVLQGFWACLRMPGVLTDRTTGLTLYLGHRVEFLAPVLALQSITFPKGATSTSFPK